VIKLVLFIAFLYLLGRSLLSSDRTKNQASAPVVLAILIGLPIAITLGFFLLTLGLLNLMYFAVLAGIFILAAFLLPKILQPCPEQMGCRTFFSQVLFSIPQSIKNYSAMHWVMCLLDTVVAMGICLATFSICQKWQGNVSPDVWAHINWARRITTTQSYNYAYMPGAHILIWLVTRVFGCSEYEAAVQLPVFFRIYFGLVAYFAGSFVLSRMAGLMLTLIFLASPVMATSHAALFLPRNLAHPLFLLGLLLAVEVLSQRCFRPRLLGAAGIAIGTTVVTHLAWDEILQCGSLALVLGLAGLLNRKLFKKIAVIVLTALAVAGPFMARMISHKLRAESFLNITLDRLTPFSFKELYARSYPAILWVGAISILTFLLIWIVRVFKGRKLQVIPDPLLKAGLLCAVWGLLAGSSLFFLLCVGKGRIEAFIYGTLPLPHPVNTEHFFTMLTFGLLGGAAMLGYLPACTRGKRRLLAIGVTIVAFIFLLTVFLNTNRSAAGFVDSTSIVMWSILGLGVLIADNLALLYTLLQPKKRLFAVIILLSVVGAAIALPSTLPLRQFASRKAEFVARPTQVQQWIIRHTDSDAVLLSQWPYVDSLEYLLDRHVEDGLLGPGALMSFHREATPGRYWRTLKFADDKIINNPDQIADALHADFGPEVYLYFRAESRRAFSAYVRIAKKLTPYTSRTSKEFFEQPLVKNPNRRFVNMIAYFQKHPQHFEKMTQDNQSVLFKLIK